MDESHLNPAQAQNGHFNEPKYSASLETESRPPSIMMGNTNPQSRRGLQRRKLILCFDGTGNKFHGDDSDSNILKIFRMLDREADDQYHYYQRE